MTNTRTPDLAEVLRAAIDAQLTELHVALPAKVEKFDAAKQKIDAKPLLKRNVQLDDGTELIEELPVITDVPVVFPRSSGFFISFPLVKGDHVLLVFNERSIDDFMSRSSGDDVDPADFRTHALADAVAFPGFYPDASALKDADEKNMVIGSDEGGMQLHITPDDTAEFKVGGVADMSAAVAEPLATWLGSHTHPTGVGPSGPPVQPVDPAITSAKLKLKGN